MVLQGSGGRARLRFWDLLRNLFRVFARRRECLVKPVFCSNLDRMWEEC